MAVQDTHEVRFLVCNTRVPREVSHEECRSLADLMQAHYFEVSVEHGTNFDDLFRYLAEELIECKQEYCDSVKQRRDELNAVLDKLALISWAVILTVSLCTYMLMPLTGFLFFYTFHFLEPYCKICLNLGAVFFALIVNFGIVVLLAHDRVPKKTK